MIFFEGFVIIFVFLYLGGGREMEFGFLFFLFIVFFFSVIKFLRVKLLLLFELVLSEVFLLICNKFKGVVLFKIEDLWFCLSGFLLIDWFLLLLELSVRSEGWCLFICNLLIKGVGFFGDNVGSSCNGVMGRDFFLIFGKYIL